MPPEQCLVHYITRSLKTHYITLPIALNDSNLDGMLGVHSKIIPKINYKQILKQP